jgi:hypothetical protein
MGSPAATHDPPHDVDPGLRLMRERGMEERARRGVSDWTLRRCCGFRVEGPGGRIGIVERLLPSEPGAEPALLAVRAGRRSRLLLLIPVDDVEAIDPHEELVVLRTPRIVGTGFAA